MAERVAWTKPLGSRRSPGAIARQPQAGPRGARVGRRDAPNNPTLSAIHNRDRPQAGFFVHGGEGCVDEATGFEAIAGSDRQTAAGWPARSAGWAQGCAQQSHPLRHPQKDRPVAGFFVDGGEGSVDEATGFEAIIERRSRTDAAWPTQVGYVFDLCCVGRETLPVGFA